MRRALQLACLAEGFTSPNPLVGALVLDNDGEIVGEGFHSRAGEAHAEVNALSQAGSKAEGGTLVVTLEPCCHQGKTPPCTEAILESGIKKVVLALEDPDPRVSGSGIASLKKAGIEVIQGVLAKEAAFQNRAFIFRVKYGRPWGVLKWAMSLDGRTALSNGASQWITGPNARKYVHRLRASCDAVIVGAGTVRLDNPLLTSRGISQPEPLRVVLTKSFDLPKDAQLWETKTAKTLIAFTPSLNSDEALLRFPESIERLPLASSQPLDLLKALSGKGCNRVLWECGPELATSAIQQGCVQEIVAFLAPKLLGGFAAKTPLAEFGFLSMDHVLTLEGGEFKKLDEDWLVKVQL